MWPLNGEYICDIQYIFPLHFRGNGEGKEHSFWHHFSILLSLWSIDVPNLFLCERWFSLIQMNTGNTLEMQKYRTQIEMKLMANAVSFVISMKSFFMANIRFHYIPLSVVFSKSKLYGSMSLVFWDLKPLKWPHTRCLFHQLSLDKFIYQKCAIDEWNKLTQDAHIIICIFSFKQINLQQNRDCFKPPWTISNGNYDYFALFVCALRLWSHEVDETPKSIYK